MSNANSLLRLLRHDWVQLAHKAEERQLTEEEQEALGKGYLLLLEKYEVFLDWCREAAHSAPPPAHLSHKSRNDETP